MDKIFPGVVILSGFLVSCIGNQQICLSVFSPWGITDSRPRPEDIGKQVPPISTPVEVFELQDFDKSPVYKTEADGDHVNLP